MENKIKKFSLFEEQSQTVITDNTVIKRDPLEMFRGAKPALIVPDTKRHHKEADLHLSFCKWLKKEYPCLQFVRHEREKFRGYAVGNMMKVYNSDLDKLPDFELLQWIICRQPGYKLQYKGLTFDSGLTISAFFTGFYLEFKKPGTTWTLADGKTLAKGFEGQYACHKHLWSIGRCAYFCNDLEAAKAYLRAYLAGSPFPQQKYLVREEKSVDLI